MKKALYYAIRVMTLYPYVVAVTSEKQNGRRWYGRDCRHDTATHGTAGDIRGRFETQVEAEALRERIGDLSNAYRERHRQVDKYRGILHELERAGMDALFRGEEPGSLPHVGIVKRAWIATSNAEWLGDGKRSLGSNLSPDNQMGGAAARVTEGMTAEAGGAIFVLPDKTKEHF